MDDSNELESRKQRIDWMKKYRQSLDGMSQPENGGQNIAVQPDNDLQSAPSAHALSNARDLQNYQGGQVTYDSNIKPMAAAELVGNSRLNPNLVGDEMNHENMFAQLKAAKEQKAQEMARQTANKSREIASNDMAQDNSLGHMADKAKMEGAIFEGQVARGEELAKKNPMLYKLFTKMIGQ